MSRSSRLIAGVAAFLFLAACGQAGDTLTGPGGPSMDTGYSTGGNREAGTQDTSAGTASADDDMTAPSDTTARGGYSTGGN